MFFVGSTLNGGSVFLPTSGSSARNQELGCVMRAKKLHAQRCLMSSKAEKEKQP